MDNNRKWYVMIHRKPEWIEAVLEKENKGEYPRTGSRASDPLPEPFEYYVPYLYMRPSASDELRSVFHSFVFINASPRRIQEITGADWNRQTQHPLCHYRKRNGEIITITETEYHRLRDIIYNSQLKVFFGVPVPPVSEMIVGNRVLLQIPGWENQPGIIEQVKVRKDSVRLRIGFDIMGQTKTVCFDDLHDGDVTFADNLTEQLITGDLIANFEKEVAILLGHRAKGRGTRKLVWRDTPRLQRLLSYADIQIEDDDERGRFTSLMLICATLLHDREASDRYKAKLRHWRTAEGTFTQAYVKLALFVNTRDPRLRDDVKAYRKAHPDCPQILGTFINKVRDFRTAKKAG